MSLAAEQLSSCSASGTTSRFPWFYRFISSLHQHPIASLQQRAALITVQLDTCSNQRPAGHWTRHQLMFLHHPIRGLYQMCPDRLMAQRILFCCWFLIKPEI